MSPSVIKGMAAFVYLAVVKDVLLCWLNWAVYSEIGMDLFTSRKNLEFGHIKTINSFLLKDEELANGDTLFMKNIQEFITFILEDFVEVGLQFFYFEKFSFMPNDILVYINALFMILKALEVTVRMIIVIKEQWEDYKESF